MTKIVPHLWYNKEAEEAAAFYAKLFPNSKVDRVTPLPIAISFVVKCEDQAEIDRYWSGLLKAGLLKAGGKEEACGWIRDHYGVCWQIVPRIMAEMMGDRDTARAKRVCEVMMKLIKLDIAKLRAAYDGK